MKYEQIIKRICKYTSLQENEVFELIEEQKKLNPQFNEEECLLIIAKELGVDITNGIYGENIEEIESILEELSIQSLLEIMDFTNVDLPLTVIEKLLKDEWYEREERVELFCKIVDEINLSKNFTELLHLIEFFPKEREVCVRDYRYECFEYLYDAVLEAGENGLRIPNLIKFKNTPAEIKLPRILMMDKFPEFIKAFEELDYRIDQYGTFRHMISGIKGTKVMKEYFILIENTFRRLLDDFYRLPDYLGKGLPTKEDLYDILADTNVDTELMQGDVPFFSKMIDLIPRDIYGTREMHGYSLILSLIGLIEGKSIMESQYLELLWTLEKLLNVFHEIYKKKDFYSTFFLLFDALMRERPSQTKEILIKKTNLFATTLNSLKEGFPQIWEEYERKSDSTKSQEEEIRSSLSEPNKIEINKSLPNRNYKLYSVPDRSSEKFNIIKVNFGEPEPEGFDYCFHCTKALAIKCPECRRIVILCQHSENPYLKRLTSPICKHGEFRKEKNKT
ncbi:MAG: hypothetical protein ACTSPU_08400 [Promethearchaeota archaeon]